VGPQRHCAAAALLAGRAMPETCVTKCYSCSHFQTVSQLLPVSANYYTCRACAAYQPCVVYKTKEQVPLRSYNYYEMVDAAKRLNKQAEAARRVNSLGYQKARVHQLLARVLCDTTEARQMKLGQKRLERLQDVERRLNRQMQPRRVPAA